MKFFEAIMAEYAEELARKQRASEMGEKVDTLSGGLQAELREEANAKLNASAENLQVDSGLPSTKTNNMHAKPQGQHREEPEGAEMLEAIAAEYDEELAEELAASTQQWITLAESLGESVQRIENLLNSTPRAFKEAQETSAAHVAHLEMVNAEAARKYEVLMDDLNALRREHRELKAEREALRTLVGDLKVQ